MKALRLKLIKFQQVCQKFSGVAVSEFRRPGETPSCGLVICLAGGLVLRAKAFISLNKHKPFSRPGSPETVKDGN